MRADGRNPEIEDTLTIAPDPDAIKNDSDAVDARTVAIRSTSIPTFHPASRLRLRSADRDAFAGAWSLVLGDLRTVVDRARAQGIERGEAG